LPRLKAGQEVVKIAGSGPTHEGRELRPGDRVVLTPQLANDWAGFADTFASVQVVDGMVAEMDGELSRQPADVQERVKSAWAADPARRVIDAVSSSRWW
jgi:hypothetical protein